MAINTLPSRPEISVERALTQFEMLTGPELATPWKVTASWVRKQSASADDPLPHVKMGRYVRFLWASPELNDWLSRRYRR